MNLLTYEDVSRRLSYDPETGILRWKKIGSRGRREGRLAGCLQPNGYRVVNVLGKLYKAHRIAWLLSYGEWPSAHLDHINRNRSDNRIANLRLSPNWENARNTPKPVTNTSGFKGVTYCKRNRKFLARIAFKGGNRHLGYFKTAEEGGKAYDRETNLIAE